MKNKICIGSAALLAALVLIAPTASAHTWIHVDTTEETTTPCGRSAAYTHVIVLDQDHVSVAAGALGMCAYAYADYRSPWPHITVGP